MHQGTSRSARVLTIRLQVGLGVEPREILGKSPKFGFRSIEINILKIRAVFNNWVASDLVESEVSFNYWPEQAENSTG